MEEIKINFSKEEKKFVEKYAKQQKETLEEYIKKAVFEQIEYEEDLDEQELLKEIENTKTDKKYTHEEVWKILGI